MTPPNVVPPAVAAVATPVGVERVYAVDGVHGSCSSYALPLDADEVTQHLTSVHGRPSASTAGSVGWRITRLAGLDSLIVVVDVYDGAHAPVPGFESDRVPTGTRCVLVVTEMYRGRATAAPRRWLRRLTQGRG